MTTCYVIAAYLGPRQRQNPRQQRDKFYYLKRHLDRLNRLRHNLDEILLVLSVNQQTDIELFSQFAKERGLSTLIRQNLGYSYGAWSDAFAYYGERFDRYIFMEDDYLPIPDGFDAKLHELLDAYPRCGYLCGLVSPFPVTGKDDHVYAVTHGSISNGIARTEALTAVAKIYGKLPFVESDTFHAGWTSQIQFTNAILRTDYELRDYSAFYSVPYNDIVGRSTSTMFGNGSLPPLFAPVEYLEQGNATCPSADATAGANHALHP